MRLLTLILYNLLLIPLLVGMLPGSLLKMRKRGGYGGRLGDRFASYSKDFRAWLAKREKPLWLHAVSVGEVNVALKLAREIRQRDAEIPIVVSTTTPTGFAIAEEALPSLGGRAIFSPLDLLPIASRALSMIRPRALVLVESEVWPNLTTLAARSGVPVILANARMSPRSESRLRRFAPLLGPIYDQLSATLVQEPEDRERWAAIGIPLDKIQHMGSVKYDPASADCRASEDPRLPEFSQLLDRVRPEPRTVVLAASTHPGEEALIAKAIRELGADFPEILFALAPRHFERGAEVVEELESLGLTPALRSRPEAFPTSPDCLIIDTTGELAAWTQLADIVVIGKSLLARGGQNPAEAALAGKAVIVGPDMSNFSPLVALLARHEGLTQLTGPNALGPAIALLLKDEEKQRILGENARAALEAHHGATGRTADAILRLLG